MNSFFTVLFVSLGLVLGLSFSHAGTAPKSDFRCYVSEHPLCGESILHFSPDQITVYLNEEKAQVALDLWPSGVVIENRTSERTRIYSEQNSQTLEVSKSEVRAKPTSRVILLDTKEYKNKDSAGDVVRHCENIRTEAIQRKMKVAIDFKYAGTRWVCSISSYQRTFNRQ